MNIWQVFTDGSIRNNGNKGAKGASGVIFYNTHNDDEFSYAPVFSNDKEDGTGLTNTQTEIMAVLYGLSFINEYSNFFGQDDTFVFYIDNQSVVKSINVYSKKWKINNWKAYDGQSIKNIKYWKLLISIRDHLGDRVMFNWVKGHTTKKQINDNPNHQFQFTYNNKVDELVTESVDNKDNPVIELDDMYNFLLDTFKKNGGRIYE